MKEIVKPFQLISYKNGKFILNQKCKKRLSKIKDTVHVIGVVGKYRTGKSYFLNRLFGIQSESKGFALGNTIESATKGIWCWVQKIKDKTILLLDSEGLYVPKNSGADYDNKIISLMLLLSSFFILNTVGTIDRTSITQLEFVVELSKQIKTFSNRESKLQDFKEFFPHFIWLVRDFFLELKNDEGVLLTDNEYLNEMLNVSKSDMDTLDEEMAKINKTKKYIKEMFPQRSCFTLVQPVNDSSKLSTLHEMDYNLLDDDFRNKMNIIVNYILSNVQKKQMFGHNWNGKIFFFMAAKFIEEVNSDRFITIDTSVQDVIKRTNEKLFLDSVNQYRTDLELALGGKEKLSRLPLDADELLKIHDDVLGKIVLEFRSTVYQEENESVDVKVEKLTKETCEKDAKGNVVGGIINEFVKVNNNKSSSKCEKLLKDLWKGNIDCEFEKLLESNNPIEEYNNLVKKVETIYKNTSNLGPNRDKIWGEHIKSKKEEKEKLQIMNRMMLQNEQKKKEMEKSLKDKEDEIKNLKEKLEVDEDKIEEIEGQRAELEKKAEAEKKRLEAEKKKLQEDMNAKTKCFGDRKCCIL